MNESGSDEEPTCWQKLRHLTLNVSMNGKLQTKEAKGATSTCAALHEIMATATDLETFVARESPFASKDLVGAFKEMPQTNRLRVLDLSCPVNLSQSTLSKILPGLPKLRYVVMTLVQSYLLMSACREAKLRHALKLTDETLHLLAQHNRKLRVLDMSGCWRITDDGLSSLACGCAKLEQVLLASIRDRNRLSFTVGIVHVSLSSFRFIFFFFHFNFVKRTA